MDGVYAGCVTYKVWRSGCSLSVSKTKFERFGEFAVTSCMCIMSACNIGVYLSHEADVHSVCNQQPSGCVHGGNQTSLQKHYLIRMSAQVDMLSRLYGGLANCSRMLNDTKERRASCEQIDWTRMYLGSGKGGFGGLVD